MSSAKAKARYKATLDMKVYRAKEGCWINLKQQTLSAKIAKALARLIRSN